MQRIFKHLILSGLLLICLDTWAQPVHIFHQPDVRLTRFTIEHYVDTSQTQDFASIQQQNFTEGPNRISLGTDSKTTWSRIHLQNQTGQKLNLSLHHPYAYHNRALAFYEVENGNLLNRQHLDLETASNSPLMFRGSAVYEFELEEGASKTLYVKNVSFSHQWFSLLVLDQNNSRRELIGTHNDIALMVGILLALVIFNFLLYYSSSQKENIYYSAYLVSGAIWIALSYGFFANQFNLYGAQLLPLHLSLMTMPMFLILFMMRVFETPQQYPLEHRFLQFILLLLVLDLCYGLFDILGALKPASSLAALMMLISLSVSISIYRKGNPLAKYFLIGHSFFVLFSGLAVLFYKGIIEFNYITSHGVGIGIMLEALMLAFVLAHRIKILEAIKASQEDLKHQAATDPLTQLYNRRHFFTQGDFMQNQPGKNNQPLSLLILDIDHFKQINDTHGHPLGDQVIILLANTLKNLSREKDLAARFGGEEFVLLLPACNLSQAGEFAQRLRKAVADLRLPLADHQEINFTISIGVAQVAQEETLEASLQRADRALYQAKNRGRNCVCLAETSQRPSKSNCGVRLSGN
ncbi:sensor domain-containing diguanylate cyclase [Marinospirillum perlucidum]|uniref:sensor domain-containing diguanylate cyclase n=1 Tax=Marinospirillum perlucidum TaxID=1982602 RepID=UPI000DF1518D|nr:diguanylate cyclase [Marinospirillum perlucidum]